MCNELHYYKPLRFGEMLVFTSDLCSWWGDLLPAYVKPKRLYYIFGKKSNYQIEGSEGRKLIAF